MSSFGSARTGFGDLGLPRVGRGSIEDMSWEVGPLDDRAGSPSASGNPDAERGQVFEGYWASKDDGELRGRIEHGHLVWEEDGTATPLWVRGERSDVISMLVDGENHYGVLSEDGRLLRWADGDVWFRVIPESAVDHSLRDQGYDSLELDEYLSWEGWTARSWAASAGKATSKSAASAAFTAYSNGAFLSYFEGSMPPKPSAVFM